VRSRARALLASLCLLAILAGACSTNRGRSPSVRRTAKGGFGSPATTNLAPGVTTTTAPSATNIYAAAEHDVLSAVVQGIPARVYVPNTIANTVDVIDPQTFTVIDHYAVGKVPHHITPSWDMTKLYVDNTEGDSLTVIDPRTGKPTGTIPVTDPYNLYFSLDGKTAIVVAERHRRIDFRRSDTWELIKSLSVPWPGVDHLDLSADGSYFLVSTEFSGQVVKVDMASMEIAGQATVGGLPVDVKVAPDGSVFYVANQARHGVSVVDPNTMQEVQFIPTGRGAHGLQISRDAKSLFVTNRLGGSVTKIDLATRTLIGTSQIGGSPDMMQISPDGTQLWFSNRNHASVSVIDTSTGELLHTIKAGRGAHGLAYFPQPGRFNVGHNGVYR
jgi:YVTN family beta-propeller protein